MASDTVPAASGAPDPTTPTPADGPGTVPAPRGWLASAIAPVDPARPAFTLPPDTGPADGMHLIPATGDSGAGDSSAAYHDDATDEPGTGTTSSAQQQGVVRAWLLAGAERWRKGAEARNKLLDLQKARAQANQRKTTVNRSEKYTGGATNAASGSTGAGSGGRGGDPKGGKPAAGGGTKNRPGGQGGGTGRGGGAGHTGATGPRTPGGSHRTPTGSGTGKGSLKNDGTGKTPKPPKTPKSDTGSGSGTGNSNTAGGGGARKNGPAGAQGPSGKAGKDPKNGSAHGTAGKDPKHTTTTTCGDASGIDKLKKTTRTDKPDSGKTDAGRDRRPDPAVPPAKDTSPKTTGPKDTGRGPAGKPDSTGKTPRPVDLKKKDPSTKATDKARPAPAKPDPAAPRPHPTADGKPLKTRASREAGYRDGARAGIVVAHAEAYKDGVQDGYRDTRKTAAGEKARLDKAHERRNRPVVPPRPDRPPVVPPPKPAVPPKPVTAPKATVPPAGPPRTVDLTKKKPPTPPAPVPGPRPPAPAPKPATPTPAKPVSLVKPAPQPKPADLTEPVPPAKPVTTPVSLTKPDKPTRTPTPKEQPVSPAPPQATPIKVIDVDATDVFLGDGAARSSISRGEVRTLKQYERDLQIKDTRMGRIAEAAKIIAGEDAQQKRRITNLLEGAKAVEGGASVVAALLRLRETATTQTREAETLHRRAVRGSENTQILFANVETRYGDMYKAVVNSPETIPAEMRFYREGGDV